jgi:fructose-1,6-bisphosphatase/inositol monophosphatase family enzyme
MSSRSLELPVALSGDDAETVARRCLAEGGRLAMERFRQPQSITVKGRGNLVTQVDLAIETYIARMLAEEFPEHALLSEESNPSVSDLRGWTWVVDPLDGTRNYVSGIPFFCINIALCFGGEPLAGWTFDPVHDELFRAKKGDGAWIGDHPLHVSKKDSVQASVMGFDMGYDDARAGHMLSLICDLWPGVQAVRIPGSAALGLAYAACGRYDLFAHNLLYPWDLAAGILLVREAGGVITDRDGGAITLFSEGAIAGGPLVHADFLRLAAGRPWRDGQLVKREGG